MHLALAILALAVFALSLWADYKWRKWMKTRRETQHDQPQNPSSRDP